jgi:hypothetical protein
VNKLTFYHQKRRDGGIRTGVEFDGERLLENFEEGEFPPDSALLWFVDIVCVGTNLPADPEGVRRWLLDRADVIRPGLRKMEEEIRAGIDSDWPVRHEIGNIDSTKITIQCSASRRIEGREIAGILRDIEKAWSKLINGLASYHAAAL